MQSIVATAVLVSTFTIYPGSNSGTPGVEAITDRGPILEMIVRCPVGTAIITYSKMEGLYCQPSMKCGRDMATVIRRSCK